MIQTTASVAPYEATNMLPPMIHGLIGDPICSPQKMRAEPTAKATDTCMVFIMLDNVTFGAR